jgi:tetratricopeptide (TPR) repeat protein
MLDETAPYKIAKLNLLAFPRNQQPICELTGLRANIQLTAQNVTLYYASEELARQAWHGIISKIVHLLPPLLQPPPIVGTQDERNRRINNITLSKRSLIEFCFTEASNLLSVKKYQLVIPAAIQGLKFSREIDGEKSLSSVEPYLQLAHAYLGLNDLKKAEEYVASARWIVLNNASCSAKTRSHLHMLAGRVFTAQGSIAGAKAEYSSSIYFCSRCFGTESISTAIGYFRLGDLFISQGIVESALAFFDKVVDIWFKYLNSLRTLESSSVTSRLSRGGHVLTKDLDQLTEENISDGYNQLENILDTRKRLLGPGHIATGECQYTLGMFEFFLLRNDEAAYRLVAKAHAVYVTKLGIDNSSTEDLGSMKLILKNAILSRHGNLDELDKDVSQSFSIHQSASQQDIESLEVGMTEDVKENETQHVLNDDVEVASDD